MRVSFLGCGEGCACTDRWTVKYGNAVAFGNEVSMENWRAAKSEDEEYVDEQEEVKEAHRAGCEPVNGGKRKRSGCDMEIHGDEDAESAEKKQRAA